jgi:hypothetical protein
MMIRMTALGIGRVVREVLPDGKYGPIYFLHYNPKWNEKNTSYPFYKTSKDKDFVQSCDELMANPLMMMQWAEETDRKDPLIPLHKEYKAFNYYHLPDGSGCRPVEKCIDQHQYR